MDLHTIAHLSHHAASALALIQDSSTSSPQLSQDQITKMGAAMAGMMGIFAIVMLAMYAFFAFLFWRIFTKAGMAGPLGLLTLVPGFGFIICLCILAFSDWKVLPAPQAAYYPPAYPPQPPVPPSYPSSTPPTSL